MNEKVISITNKLNTVKQLSKSNDQRVYSLNNLITHQDILDSQGINTIDDFNLYIQNILNTKIIIYFNKIDQRFYNINKIDKSLDSIYNINFETVLSVINAWVFKNFDLLKTHNKSLIDTAILVFPFMKIISGTSLRNAITDYIEYWFEKNTINNFDLDLFNSMYLYIFEKFKYKYNI